MVIKEVTYEELFLDAISFVSRPANEINFLEFTIENKLHLDEEADKKAIENEELLRILIEAQNKIIKDKYEVKFYKYQEVDTPEYPGGKNREFCKNKIGKVFDEYTIREWANMSAQMKKDNGFIKGYGEAWLGMFPMLGFKCENFLYNCKHYLEEVPQHLVPKWRKDYLEKTRPNRTKLNKEFKLSMDKQQLNLYSDIDQTITGVVLEANSMIYRKTANIKTGQEGYIYFKKDTIKKLQENFNNKYFTYDHRLMLNSVEILESYISENKHTLNGVEIKDGSWIIRCKINDKVEYERIKNLGDNAGFSIEGYTKSL